MKKKFLLHGIAAVFLLSIPVSVNADSVWDFNDEYLYVDDYTGSESEIVVPEILEDAEVIGIGDDVFGSMTNLTSLEFEDQILEIQRGVGYGCENLSRLVLPNNLLTIGENCFTVCTSLEEITIPAEVCFIGRNAFSSCDNLRSVTFEGTCPVFDGCSFNWIAEDAVIYVPDDQLEAYQEAFAKMNLAQMPQIQGSGESAQVWAADEYLDTDNLVFDAETGTILRYEGFETRLTIPEQIDDVQVEKIGPEAFRFHYYLRYLTLPEGLTEISEDAFFNASLLYVDFPSTLKTVDARAFSGGYNSGILDLPESLELIGEEAFSYSLIRNLTVPQGVREIAASAFADCMWLYDLSLPDSLEKIGENAFADSGLGYVYIDGIELPEISATAFSECEGLADIDLDEHCTKEQMLQVQEQIDAMGLECRVWRRQNTELDYCYENDTYIINPNDSNTMYFAGYTGEKTHIRGSDFYIDENGETRNITGIADGALKGNQTVIYYGVNHNDVFTYIGKEAFADSKLEQIDLFDSVTTIGESAFRNCSGLKEVVLPESVTEIGAGAFEGCSGLKELILPKSVTKIGADAFSGCTGLEKVTVLCDAGVLPENAFANSTSLAEANIVSGEIPAGAFENSALAYVELGEGITSIGDRAFAGTLMTEVSFGDAIKTIGTRAFAESSLTTLDTNKVETIGEEAFLNSPLEKVTLGVSLQTISANTFDGIERSVIRMSDDAADEQIQMFSEILEYPWYDSLIRVSETPVFTKMPNQPSPEEDFLFDAETGTITEYIGSDVDVVIPRTIGDVEVQTIAYNTFTAARDYSDPEAGESSADCLQLRSVVIPETVTMIEDSVFGSCPKLETVICYAPLENSGKSTFENCVSLKTVVFVNKIKAFDSYAFNTCKALETLWYQGTLDFIGEQCFTRCGLSSIIVDAKKINEFAFSSCENLKEIHIRKSAEFLDISALNENLSLTTVCIENPDIEGGGWLGGDKAEHKIILPEDTTEEQRANFAERFGSFNTGWIWDEAMIELGACSAADITMPDVTALLNK